MTQATNIDNIRNEPLITKNWGFEKTYPANFPDGILITGSNSFIGAHIVNLLQRQWEGQIHLLLRSKSNAEAIDKMSQAFAKWDLGTFHAVKFSIHTGEVCQPMMGLNTTNYYDLKAKVGFVLHLAMNPRYNLPYGFFKKVWLPELRQMISFCGDKCFPKSLHYPSSFNAGFFISDADFSRLNTNAWQSGYAGFKWVANKVIENAFEQNLNGCLYDIPLVLGSVEKNLCPRQYSIWYILDMFLKTKCYIPFQFRLIPVDGLAEVMVENIIADRNNQGSKFLRPVLEEPVSDEYFNGLATSLLGLQKTDRDLMRNKYINKRIFDFVFPPDFHGLLGKVNKLPAIFPENYEMNRLPSTKKVFMGNLGRILSMHKVDDRTPSGFVEF